MTASRLDQPDSARVRMHTFTRFTPIAHLLILVGVAVLTVVLTRRGSAALLHRMDVFLWGLLFLCASVMTIQASVSRQALPSMSYALFALGALAAATVSVVEGPVRLVVNVLAALAMFGSIATSIVAQGVPDTERPKE